MQMGVVANFLMVSCAYMSIWFISKVRILKLVIWSYMARPGMLTIEWLVTFEHVVPSLLNTCLFGVPFLDSHLPTQPLKYRCLRSKLTK